MSDLKNKVVLITGSSSGIGAMTALEFARNGAKVMINYKANRKGAEDSVNQINQLNIETFSFQADVSVEKEAAKLINETINMFGTLDIVVNNAGGYIEGDEWNKDNSAWKQTLDNNLISVLNISKYATKYFLENKKGNFINIASVRGLKGIHDGIAYSASKAGVINITQAYAKLLAPFGRANSISPGPVNTGYWLNASDDELQEQYDKSILNKLSETLDIANAIIFLASNKSQMITGQNICIDGGFSIL